MKYEIYHFRHGVDGKEASTVRVAIVQNVEDAVVMAAALATACGQRANRTRNSPGLSDSIHIDARFKTSRAFSAGCFICERDPVQDVIGALDQARAGLKRWKQAGAEAKARMEWAKANFASGKGITDYWHDEAFKTAFFSNDFAKAGERLKVLRQPTEAAA